MPRNTSLSFGERSRLLADTYVALSKDEQIWGGKLTSGLRHIARACANALGVHRASVWQLEPDYSRLTCLTLYREDTDQYEQGMELEARSFPRYFAALANNRVIAAADAQNDPRTREFTEIYLKPLNIISMLDGTLRSEGKTRGVLCLEETGNARLWTREEQDFIASVSDLVSQLMLLNTLRESETRYRALFDGSVDGVFVLRNGVFIECNQAALKLFSCTRDQLLGQPPARFSPPAQPDGEASSTKAQRKIEAAIQGAPQNFEWRHCCFDGTPFEAEVNLNLVMLDGNPCLMATVRNIDDRKVAEQALLQSRQQLEYRANHDSLTGLPNRDYLHEQAAHAILNATVQKQHLAFLLMDLNRFKEVNDTLGHSIGDHLLKLLAARLLAVLQPLGAMPYRLGGDEFAVMTSLLNSPQEALDVATRVGDCLRQPISVEGISLELGASIGISLFPEHGGNSHQMLRCADVAMYYAKTHGTGIALYASSQDSNSPRRLTMMAELGTAIRENQLVLHYQPRIDLHTGACTGCEALLRWQHPKHGMIPPGDFIPAAEMSDIIHPLSQWVLRNALEQIKRWLNEGLSLPVAVNLSARNLADCECPDKIAQLLETFAVPPHLLEIEITESALISDPERAMQVVDRIHQLGIPLAIDDFGTGYSSLSYLKRLPIDTLKIDRTFVKDMRGNEADAVIVRSTIALAHSFGLKVVAEGVEDSATLDELRQLSCDQAQGFGIARPLPIAALTDWLHQHSRN